MRSQIPKVVSTFAGCGGSSTGYELAGCEVVFAVEFDKHAVETYRANHPKTFIYDRDITDLSAEFILKTIKLKKGELDILDGSPPCQGFSTAGLRAMNDSRNRLFEQYTRLLSDLQPKAFVMENVSGMVKGKMKLIFAEILRATKACGYQVRARVLNAKYFGVPQSRQRMIFIGFRNDLGIGPKHPKAVTAPITIRQAFKNLPEPNEPRIKLKYENEILGKVPEGGRIIDHCDPKYIKEVGARLFRSPEFSPQRLRWNQVCPVIIKTFAAWDRQNPLHPSENRYLTIPELKRVASFPDDYQFTGSFKDIHARIGNSVPPNLMKHIALSVKTQLRGVS